jgi:hypothetical protein
MVSDIKNEHASITSLYVLAQFILAQLLRNMGFPQKKFGKKAEVNTRAVDSAVQILIQIGIGLGVGRPALAVHALADSFQLRDWSGDSATKLLNSIDPNQRIVTNCNKRPCQAIAPPSLADMGRESIPWQSLGDPRLAPHYTGAFAQGLIWGLLYPKEAEKASDMERIYYEQQAPFWISHGLKISPKYAWATNADFYNNCEQMVESFVSDRRPLVNTPKELLSEPRIMQRFRENTEA